MQYVTDSRFCDVICLGNFRLFLSKDMSPPNVIYIVRGELGSMVVFSAQSSFSRPAFCHHIRIVVGYRSDKQMIWIYT